MLKKLCLYLLFIPFFINAQYPAQPSNYITDETGIIRAEEQSQINNKLRAYEDSTSTQIFVYVANSLNGADLETISQEIFHNWKIGQQGKNNGVLIAVFVNDRKFRIQTGYGMEGVLPDLLTKRIQDEDMRPFFKEGKYGEGIIAGIDKLIYYCNNGYQPEPAVTQSDDTMSAWLTWLLAYIFNLILFLLYVRKVRKGKRSTVVKTILIVIAIIMFLIPCIGSIILFIMLVASSNISFSGSGSSDSGSSWSSSDSSWSSSDSGSSFDGGGGGDSGGGGSSSDW